MVLRRATPPTPTCCAGVERGIWVTRFRYVNVVHPTQTVLTGMTRDGTFLIEHGEIGRPVRNLRFTTSVLDALASVEAIGQTPRLLPSWLGGSLRPRPPRRPLHLHRRHGVLVAASPGLPSCRPVSDGPGTGSAPRPRAVA